MSNQLRKKAEELLEQGTFNGSDYSGKEQEKLIEELRLHQAELEVQNEELRESHEQLRTSRDRFSSLFHYAPVGYLVLDQMGMILDVNLTFCEMVQTDRTALLRKPFSELVVQQDTPLFLSRYGAFYKNPQNKTIELELLVQGRTNIFASLCGRHLQQDHTGHAGQEQKYFFVVATDITRQKQAEERERHTQKILRAVRSIGKLITSEVDAQQLIAQACTKLTEHLGYHNAWIALFDEHEKQVTTITSAGFGNEFSLMRERLLAGTYPSCMGQALQGNSVVVVKNPPSECIDCPLSKEYGGCAGFIQRLGGREETYGVLAVSVPQTYAQYQDVKDLFAEVGRDISFALSRMQLAQNYKRAHQIVERSPAVAFVWDNAPGWPVAYVSENLERIFGWRVQQFLANELSYLDIIHPDDRDRVGREVSSSSRKRSSMHVEHQPYRIKGADGRFRWVDDRTFIHRDENGTITHYEGIVLDISSQKRTEDIASSFFNQPLNLHLISNIDGTISQVNGAWLEQLGYEREGLVGRRLLDLVHPADIESTLEKMKGLATGRPVLYFENRFRHKDGHYRLLAWSGSTSFDLTTVYAVAKDITERRTAERALQQSTERLKRVAELSSDYFYGLRVDDSGELVTDWLSDSFETVTSYAIDEIDHFNAWLAHVHSDDVKHLEESLSRLLKNQRVVTEYRITTKHGDTIWLEERLQPMWDHGNQRVKYVYGAAQNITARKNLETDLQRLTEQQQTVFETAMAGIMVVHDRVMTLVNTRMAEMLGYHPRELTGVETKLIYLSYDDYVDFGERYYSRLKEEIVVQIEYLLRRRNGEAVLCLFNGRAIHPPDLSQGVVWVIDDITERKESERRSFQLRKEESLSRLAGSVAHHFNNILTATIGRLELAKRDVMAADAVFEHIEEAERATLRAVKLSQLMLTYLGQSQRKRQMVALKEAWKPVLDHFAGKLTGSVELDVENHESDLAFEADIELLQQLLEIVLENALESLEGMDQGIIHIIIDTVEEIDISEKHRHPNYWYSSARRFARCVIADSGKGIAEEQLELIFDPFFSDKFTGRGLGLAVALGIVRAHQGYISVASTLGKGTRFSLYFPL